ncbi:MAG: ATP-binding protein [Leptospirales bacterium]
MKKEFIDFTQKNGKASCHYIAVMRPDLDLLPIVIDHVEQCMLKENVSEDDRVQVQILCEEILSNALFATAERNSKGQVIFHSLIEKSKATIIVLDCGCGMDKEKIKEYAAINDSIKDPHDQLRRVQRTTHIKKSGKLHRHFRFGKGLKMIHKISDILEILYYSHDGFITPHLPAAPKGTLVISTYIYKYKL